MAATTTDGTDLIRIDRSLQRLVAGVWGLLVLGFGAGVSVTSAHSRLAAVEAAISARQDADRLARTWQDEVRTRLDALERQQAATDAKVDMILRRIK